jgi:hypothetical protein
MKNFEALSNFYCPAAAAGNEGDTSIMKERYWLELKVRLLANTQSFVQFAK